MGGVGACGLHGSILFLRWLKFLWSGWVEFFWVGVWFDIFVWICGIIFNGNQGIGGEWGHNFLDESGGPCYCGKKGCVETVIAGPSLERYYKSISGKEGVRLKEIVKRYEDGEENAKKTMDRLTHFFGLGISTIINVLDPEVIVLGGGVGNIDLLYTEGVKEAEKYTFNTRFDTKIVKPKLGDSAGVFGAAFLVA